MLQNGGRYLAGRVSRFLSHTAPGCEPNHEDDVNIADVQLYKPVAASHAAAAQAGEDIVGCPIFRDTLVDAKSGNFWPILKLTPSKFAAVPDHSGPNHIMVLNRFSSWKTLVPS